MKRVPRETLTMWVQGFAGSGAPTPGKVDVTHSATGAIFLTGNMFGKSGGPLQGVALRRHGI